MASINEKIIPKTIYFSSLLIGVVLIYGVSGNKIFASSSHPEAHPEAHSATSPSTEHVSLADTSSKEEKKISHHETTKEAYENEIEEFCGELKAFTGELEILDSARTQILSTKVGIEIPCGAWVTVLSGWAELSHRDGYEVRAAESTFFSWSDHVPGDHRYSRSEKRISLYRGSLLVKAEKGGPEVRVDTPSAVARIKSGRAIVIFDEATDESQLVGVQSKSTLENRYVQQSAVTVNPGELTRLGLKEKRIVPTPPAALATAPLRPLVMGFGLIGQEKMEVLTALESRRKTLFPSVPRIKELKNRAISNVDHRDQKRYVQTNSEDFKGLPEFGASGIVDKTKPNDNSRDRRSHFDNHTGSGGREIASAGSGESGEYYPLQSKGQSIRKKQKPHQSNAKEKARLLREIRSLRPE